MNRAAPPPPTPPRRRRRPIGATSGHDAYDARMSRGAQRRLRTSLAMLLGVIVVGWLGYIVLSDHHNPFESLYMIVVILSTVGMKSGAGPELNDAERVWTLVMMVAGVGVTFYAGGVLISSLVDGELRRLLGRRALQRQIDRLDGHYVICGYGRMGRALADELARKEVPFVVIEADSTRTVKADAAGYLYLNGDALTEATLRAARLDDARALACCLGEDADNVFVTLTARDMLPDLTIIARAEHMSTVPRLRRAGADRVVCPPVASARQVMQMMLQPAVEELVELAVRGPDLEISKINTRELPEARGRTLRELELPARTGLMVVAIVSPDGDRTMNPPPDRQLGEHDELIVVGPSGGSETLMRCFGDRARRRPRTERAPSDATGS